MLLTKYEVRRIIRLLYEVSCIDDARLSLRIRRDGDVITVTECDSGTIFVSSIASDAPNEIYHDQARFADAYGISSYSYLDDW